MKIPAFPLSSALLIIEAEKCPSRSWGRQVMMSRRTVRREIVSTYERVAREGIEPSTFGL